MLCLCGLPIKTSNCLLSTAFFLREIHSRYDIWLENYSKTINIESNTMVEMVQKDLLPSVLSYVEEIASTASLKASVVPGISCKSETTLITKLSQLSDAMTKGLEKLKADTARPKAAEDVLENAKLYQTEVLEDMEELRRSADEAETLIPDDLLPYPTYGKLLFYLMGNVALQRHLHERKSAVPRLQRSHSCRRYS